MQIEKIIVNECTSFLPDDTHRKKIYNLFRFWTNITQHNKTNNDKTPWINYNSGYRELLKVMETPLVQMISSNKSPRNRGNESVIWFRPMTWKHFHLKVNPSQAYWWCVISEKWCHRHVEKIRNRDFWKKIPEFHDQVNLDSEVYWIK